MRITLVISWNYNPIIKEGRGKVKGEVHFAKSKAHKKHVYMCGDLPTDLQML